MFHTVRRTVAAGAVGATLALVAGCGGGNDLSNASPKQELTQAFDNLTHNDTVLSTVKVNATAQQLADVQRATGGTVSASDQRIFSLITGGSLVIEAKGSKPLSDYAKPSDRTGLASSFVLNAAGSPLVQVRSVDRVLYAQADVQKILQIAKAPAGTYEQLQTRVPSTLTWAQAALRGQWVSLDEKQLQQFSQQITGQSPNPQQQMQLFNKLKATLEADSTVTRVGSTDQGDHLVVTAQSRKLLTDIVHDLSGVLPAGALNQFSGSSIPDRTVKVDAYVKDDRLSQLSLELTQFASGSDARNLAGKHVPLVVSFATDGPSIDKPSGATPVDLQQLGSLFQQLGSSHGSGGGASSYSGA